jgi:membrane protein DedA with SNARE-associated domain
LKVVQALVSNILSLLSAEPSSNELLAYAGLFIGTFVQEGLAIAAGAALIVEHNLSPVWVAVSLISGMVLGDLLIFGLGAFARDYLWAQRLAGHRVVAETTAWLHRNVISMVALSRVVPGILFPTFIAYGWSGLPFARFALLSLISTSAYATLCLVALSEFGEAAIPHVGHWAWVGVAVTMLASIMLTTHLATRQLRASLRS